MGDAMKAIRWSPEQLAAHQKRQARDYSGTAAIVAKPIERPQGVDTFPLACVAAGLPPPVCEHSFARPRRWRFDYAWPAPGNDAIALEVEGGAFTQGRHTRGAGFVADLEKYSEAAIMGWCVLRVTPEQLLTKGIDLVKRAREARGL